ncbi:MAG: hypothetical protein JSV91_11380 [Phycisphaerales bacterium]|nr:MAG: hypothetical protein JSV91_11380 [Phycisphaerales bacterium]
MAHLCLIRIGPPPAVRINPLWVLDHQGIVEAVIWATVLAGAGSALPITLGRRRVAVIVLWVLATAAALAFFSDRLLIIGRILLSRAG